METLGPIGAESDWNEKESDEKRWLPRRFGAVSALRSGPQDVIAHAEHQLVDAHAHGHAREGVVGLPVHRGLPLDSQPSKTLSPSL